MFGFCIVILIFVAAARVGSWIVTAGENRDWVVNAKEIAKEQGRSEYLMKDGHTWRNMKTGQEYTYKVADNGDRLKVSKKGDVIENVTEVKRNKKIEDSIGNSRFMVDDTKSNRRRLEEQKAANLTRVMSKFTHIDYFRKRDGNGFVYQDLDCGRYIYSEGDVAMSVQELNDTKETEIADEMARSGKTRQEVLDSCLWVWKQL